LDCIIGNVKEKIIYQSGNSILKCRIQYTK